MTTSMQSLLEGQSMRAVAARKRAIEIAAHMSKLHEEQRELRSKLKASLAASCQVLACTAPPGDLQSSIEQEAANLKRIDMEVRTRWLLEHAQTHHSVTA